VAIATSDTADAVASTSPLMIAIRDVLPENPR
jgi:hypothetical protein